MIKYVLYIPTKYMQTKKTIPKLTSLPMAIPPFELYRRLCRECQGSFILESAVGEQRTIAYSFLGFDPDHVLRCDRGRIIGGEGLDHLREEPVAFLKEFQKQNQVQYPLLPFIGGLVGYFSYEFAAHCEPSFPGPRHPDFPEFELGLYREGIIYDHSNFQAYHFSLDESTELLERVGSLPEVGRESMSLGEPRHSMSREAYQEGVKEVKGRIHDGEAFQVVLSRSEERSFSGDPLALYTDLRRTNPSPYMFYLDFGRRKLLGSSPETLVTVKGREATTFPIAGTRPVGIDAQDRRRLREEMLRDEKERAEHCMLVDLARNDLGKVAEFGSVHVPEFMGVAAYSHVQHIVSRVCSTLRDGREATDALAAVFPAGTLSGAPKPRAMEIIADLEGRARGPYGGGVGYLSFNGNLDSAITIRSAFVSDDRLTIQAGAGIVADSDPRAEFLESEHKLSALTAALRRCRTMAEEGAEA